MACMTTTLTKSTNGLARTSLKQKKSPTRPAIYDLRPLSGNFNLLCWNADPSGQPGALVFFLGAPDGALINNALVVVTIMNQAGAQQMLRARPRKGGYLVDTEHLKPDLYRLEIEIVTKGWLLTDELYFHKV